MLQPLPATVRILLEMLHHRRDQDSKIDYTAGEKLQRAALGTFWESWIHIVKSIVHQPPEMGVLTR
jgi:hypothetical protein